MDACRAGMGGETGTTTLSRCASGGGGDSGGSEEEEEDKAAEVIARGLLTPELVSAREGLFGNFGIFGLFGGGGGDGGDGLRLRLRLLGSGTRRLLLERALAGAGAKTGGGEPS